MRIVPCLLDRNSTKWNQQTNLKRPGEDQEYMSKYCSPLSSQLDH